MSEIDVERTEIEQKLNDLQVEKTLVEEEFINLVGEIPNLPLPEIRNQKLPENIENIYPIIISKKDIESARQSIKAA